MEFMPNSSPAREKLLNPSQPETSQAVESILNMVNLSTENLDALNEDEISQALDLARKYHEASGHRNVDRTVIHKTRRDIENRFVRMMETALERGN